MPAPDTHRDTLPQADVDTAAQGPSPVPLLPPIRVFLVDDHAITLWGLQRLIEGGPQPMRVVGTAGSRAALLQHPAQAPSPPSRCTALSIRASST